MARHVLGIDLGTSALKVALVSMAGEVVASEQETCTVTLLPGGGAEQDPRQWWEQVARVSSRPAIGGGGLVHRPVVRDGAGR
jgi:xylulokinase